MFKSLVTIQEIRLNRSFIIKWLTFYFLIWPLNLDLAQKFFEVARATKNCSKRQKWLKSYRAQSGRSVSGGKQLKSGEKTLRSKDESQKQSRSGNRLSLHSVRSYFKGVYLSVGRNENPEKLVAKMIHLELSLLNFILTEEVNKTLPPDQYHPFVRYTLWQESKLASLSWRASSRNRSLFPRITVPD